MFLEDDHRPSSPLREALRAGVSTLTVLNNEWEVKERAHLGQLEQGMSAIITEIERLTSQKMQLLGELDSHSKSRPRFGECIPRYIDANERHFDEAEYFLELNTLRPRVQVALHVRQTSEHLLVHKGERKETIKTKSFRIRLEELNKKIAEFRGDMDKLKKRVRQCRAEMMERNGGGKVFAEFRQKLTAGAFGPDKLAEIRTLRAFQEELRLVAAQKKRKKLLVDRVESAVKYQQEKARKMKEMRIESVNFEHMRKIISVCSHNEFHLSIAFLTFSICRIRRI